MSGIRTPSLRRRVVVAGVVVVAAVLLLVTVFVYLTLQQLLEDSLDEVLTARLELADELAALHPPDELSTRLQASGISARVIDPEGEVHLAEPATPRFVLGPPGPLADVPAPRVSRTLELADGSSVEVFATRAGVEATLRRLLLLLGLASVLSLGVAVLLLRRATAYAIAPLDQVVAAADRTAAGHTGDRLAPDRPDTELGRMAVSYDRMLDSLEAALGDARDAEERTRRFVDDAAHQLRTPLAGVRSSVEALLFESDPMARDRLLGNLIRETGRSNRLLTSLLTIARADHDQPREPVPTELGAICRDEVERTSSLAPELTIGYRASSDVEDTWLLDDRGTHEILANLLDNARRHARANITVDAELTATEPGRGSGQPMIELRVSDDGPGIPPGADEEVFDRFTSLDGRGGSGLGLPIARALARVQGGELTHHDGSFVLRVPARRAEKAAAPRSDP